MENEDIKKAFGERLKKAREEMNMTQEQLGSEIGCSKATISNYERGEQSPGVEYLVKLSSALGVTPNDLVIGSEEERERKPEEEVEEIVRKVGEAIVFYGFEVTHGDIGKDNVYQYSLSLADSSWSSALSEYAKIAKVKNRFTVKELRKAIRETAHESLSDFIFWPTD